MTNEEILEKQIEALEKLLQLRTAIIEELESKVARLESEKISLQYPGYGGVTVPWTQPFIGGGSLTVPYTSGGTVTISNGTTYTHGGQVQTTGYMQPVDPAGVGQTQLNVVK